MKIEGYDYPDDLFYDKEHNWARIEGNTAIIGVTDFGQELAGEIVYAEVPRVGREITQGQPFMSIESGKWVGRVNAIVSGKITEANEEIEWESSLINEDPYGEGWFAKVEMTGEPEGLLKSDDPALAELVVAEKEKYGK
ncbi:MAG: glycine cleavage system H protein [Anaerolineae bacterium]|jgi:glycine cleavage system H protein